MMRLTNGSRVVIVGGGPAGSFAALHLLKFAREAQLSLDVLILEPRDFSRPGPGGCNKCAGILSSSLPRDLQTLGLNLPDEIIQAELDTYILHLDKTEFQIHRPDSERRIMSVYRGSGPRLGDPPFPNTFDGWLLDQARERGVIVQRARVRSIQPGPRPLVITAQETLEADLVIVATGVNSRPPLDLAWSYHPPRTEVMAQDEIFIPTELSDHCVHVYFDYPPGLIFGALIPKGRYANISLLGRRLPPGAVDDFLDGNGFPALFPDGFHMLCGCTPRVAVTGARGYFADRMVVVGDAAVTRLYKNGIGMAFITARAAAQTAIQRGVSRRDFARGYAPICRGIIADNLYGRVLFFLWDTTRRIPFLSQAWKKAVAAEINQPPQRQIHIRILWGMFSGDEPYRRLFWISLSPSALVNLWKGLLENRHG
ncbi:MAG: NAD(P)/FAD-dependent oxidoreductase [Chloroflexi bacterium]|nr:NAD(P)/FAD-dependent oxidoreductase [Chloroflexota bacterium]